MSDEPQRPTTDDRDAWKAYWTAQGMPWRTEPEIDEERRRYLAERRAIELDVKQGIYPFTGITLTRADVEWLLATHEDGRGPVLWIEEQDKPDDQRRWGLDLRDADLTGVDLSRLPLARLRGGSEVLVQAKTRQKPQPVMHLEGAHLEGANLGGTHLEGAHLEGASLAEARLEGANLTEAHLERADLRRAYLDANTGLAAVWLGAQRLDVYARAAEKTGVRLLMVVVGGMLQTSFLYLFGLMAMLGGLAFLQVLFFESTHAVVNGPLLLLLLALLGLLLFRRRPDLQQASGALLADVHWGGTNLAVVDWQRMRVSGDELHASKRRDSAGRGKNRKQQHADCQSAARTYRQLAVELRSRGLNEDADAFAFRAQLMQRRVLLREYKPGRWVGSLLLDLISGYGYRPGRTLFWYTAVIAAFAYGFSQVTHGRPLFGLVTPACDALLPTPGCIHPLQWYEALVLSISSFHGRGFFQPLQNPGDPVAILAAAEAVFGLLIEITFIATFTQRFFAR